MLLFENIFLSEIVAISFDILVVSLAEQVSFVCAHGSFAPFLGRFVVSQVDAGRFHAALSSRTAVLDLGNVLVQRAVRKHRVLLLEIVHRACHGVTV